MQVAVTVLRDEEAMPTPRAESGQPVLLVASMSPTPLATSPSFLIGLSIAWGLWDPCGSLTAVSVFLV